MNSMVLLASGKERNLVSKKEERCCLLSSSMDLENKPAIQEQAPPPISQGPAQCPITVASHLAVIKVLVKMTL